MPTGSKIGISKTLGEPAHVLVCRRAAHFANYKADDSDEERHDIHAGGKEASCLHTDMGASCNVWEGNVEGVAGMWGENEGGGGGKLAHFHSHSNKVSQAHSSGRFASCMKESWCIGAQAVVKYQ